MKTKKKTSGKRTLRDRLSRLEYRQACKLLGDEGKRLITQGGKYNDIDIDRDVYLRGDLFRLSLRDADSGANIRVTLTLMASKQNRLVWNCDHCESACEHVGAAFSLILEDKYSLGLADIPKPGVPLELLGEDELVERAVAERAQRARDEPFRLQSSNPKAPWTDYVITSGLSGKSYRVALRGETRGVSFCSCPDFRTNTLGTCKHILYALDRVTQKFSASTRARQHRPREFCVHLRYGEQLTLWLQPPHKASPDALQIAGKLAGGPIDDVHGLLRCVEKLHRAGQDVTIYPDAEEWIHQQLFQDRVASLVEEIRRDPEQHPLRSTLLKTELLPYQLDGIAFAVGAGRAVLADDMGLGKTIQGIGVSELLGQTAGIERVLVVCPATLKSQWCSEISRFSERDHQIILGTGPERAEQYRNSRFFTICNYEQVLRDFPSIERVKWDLIILDEGQRIKNWESKTSNVIKALKSPFALVLSGTPLENRLDDLFSVIQFVDDRRLAPAFRFFHRHRVVDDRGKVIAYKNLDELREHLRPVLLRRTREAVLNELPERNTHVMRIQPTLEQKQVSDANVAKAARIAAKKFLTEMDLLQIQQALLKARMAADSTYLVDKQEPAFSTKLEFLDSFVERLFSEPTRKAVLFSEWTTMLGLIEPILAKHKIEFVRLDGSVPQKKRQQLVHRFQKQPECKVFMTTNAGSTGLNLQAANTVINVDLPWNPAILEQRIARAHRMGQQQPVDVYLLITEATLEERMLTTLAQKHDLAIAALDADSQVSYVDFRSGLEAMRARLETLLGTPAPAPVDQTAKQQAEQQIEQFGAHRQRVAKAGGELLGAVFQFLGELVEPGDTTPPPKDLVASVRGRLDQCLDEDQQGRQKLTMTLPNRESVDQLAQTLARILVAGGGEGES